MLQTSQYVLAAGTVFAILALIANLIAVGGYKKNAVAADGHKVPDDVSGVRAKKEHSAGWYGTAFHIVSLLAITVYLAMRVALTGHGPFANQHEFAVSFSWGILLVFLFFAVRYGLKAVSLVVFPVVIGLLIYAHTQEIAVIPLVPALQNSYLLTLHVGFAVLAYGAACVSFGAAVLWLIQPRIPKEIRPKRDLLDEIGYRAAIVTFPLLTIMILLGALWADTAWGRYWGWDPKETAAFVTWLIYGGYLHARVVGDWRGKRSAWLLILGFAAVLFAYFGNHFFGGLHSYA